MCLEGPPAPESLSLGNFLCVCVGYMIAQNTFIRDNSCTWANTWLTDPPFCPGTGNVTVGYLNLGPLCLCCDTAGNKES